MALLQKHICSTCSRACGPALPSASNNLSYHNTPSYLRQPCAPLQSSQQLSYAVHSGSLWYARLFCQVPTKQQQELADAEPRMVFDYPVDETCSLTQPAQAAACRGFPAISSGGTHWVHIELFLSIQPMPVSASILLIHLCRVLPQLVALMKSATMLQGINWCHGVSITVRTFGVAASCSARPQLMVTRDSLTLAGSLTVKHGQSSLTNPRVDKHQLLPVAKGPQGQGSSPLVTGHCRQLGCLQKWCNRSSMFDILLCATKVAWMHCGACSSSSSFMLDNWHSLLLGKQACQSSWDKRVSGLGATFMQICFHVAEASVPESQFVLRSLNSAT